MTLGSRLADYLGQMLQGAMDALAFTEGMDREGFADDLRTQRAVIMSLMIIGEAANRVLSEAPAFAEANADILWRGIRGMRNRIAHGYFDVDLAVVWQTVVTELPPLVKQLAHILTAFSDGAEGG